MLVPGDLRFRERKRELIGLGPDGGESGAERIERSFVNRIIREIQLMGAPRLDDESE
jgi:hypothetical protein